VKQKALGLFVVLAAVAAAYGLYEVSKKPERRPIQAAREMEFPMGIGGVIGRGDGVVCHQVVKRLPGKPDEVVRYHEMPYDFRDATEEQKKAWIIEDTVRDLGEIGMACAPSPDPGFLSVALAQPHCEDCGGGCGSSSCPAHVVGSGCWLNGTNCVITIICCSGAPCGCD
jgi:hypothetical protein